MRAFRFAILSVLMFSTLLVAQENWPQFRGPTGDGHSSAKNLPTTWSETENILWKTPIHDKGWSSPVVWGNQVWVTTATEDGKSMFVMALDAKSGKVLHDVKVFENENPPDMRKYNSYASPTPVIEEGRIYAHFGEYGTACLDTATGKVLWTNRELKCDHFRAPASSPILWQDWLYLTFDGYDVQYVAALEKATGKLAWKTDRETKFKTSNGDMKKAYSTPSLFEINGQWQLVSPGAEQTMAYDPKTGKEIWRISHGGMNEACKPVMVNDLIILSSGHTSNMLAVKAGRTGELGTADIAWEFTKQGPSRPSVVAYKDHLYFCNDKGVAYCLNAKTGEKLWQERLDGGFSSSPILAEGKLYFFGENGKTFIVEASPEYNLIGMNRLEDGGKTSPAVAGETLLLRTFTHLYCIGKK